VRQRFQSLAVVILILWAPLAIFARAPSKETPPAKNPPKPVVPAKNASPKKAPAADKSANARKAASKKVASQKDTQTGDNTPADPGANTDAGGNNSTDGTTPQKDTPSAIRASLAALQCDSNPTTEPAQSLCKHLILLHHQKASDILPLVADQAEGLSVKAFGDKLLLVGPPDAKNPPDQPAAAEAPIKDAKSKQPESKVAPPPAGHSKPATNPAAVAKQAADANQAAEDKQKADAKETATLLRLRRLVAALDTANSAHSSIIRLYNERDAEKTAAALGGAAKPLGPDLLVFPDTSPNAGSLARQAAILDLPRPVVTLNVWNVELSTRSERDLDQLEVSVNQTVENGNDVLQSALQGGWQHLIEAIKVQPTPFDPDFKNYIGQRFMSCADTFDATGRAVPGTGPEECGNEALRTRWDACTKDQYCLGYTEAFIWGKPSLSKMIFLLASMNDGAESVPVIAGEIATRMKTDGAQRAKELLARPSDTQSPCDNPKSASGLGAVQFPQFGRLLTQALTGERRQVLRASIADFLFQYKWSFQYPNEFVAYDLSHSADKLDGQFAPIVEGFNRDVEAYLTSLFQPSFQCAGQSKKVTFYSSGAVTLSANSGTAAQVTVGTANKFDTTPPFTIAQYMTALSDAEKNIPDLAKATPYAHEIAAATALLNTQKPSSVNVGKTFDLQVTPTSLATGSAVDLNISLTTSEDANAPGQGGSDASAKTDDTSRIVSGKVVDDVRIETQRLFQVSSFAAAIRRGRTPFIVPLLGEIPYLGQIFQFPRRPESIYHRTFAVAHALVVPTAQDLGYSIRFDKDRQLIAKSGGLPTKNQFYASSYDLPPQVLSFHKRKLQCWLNMQPPADCATLTFADLPEDAGSK